MIDCRKCFIIKLFNYKLSKRFKEDDKFDKARYNLY